MSTHGGCHTLVSREDRGRGEGDLVVGGGVRAGGDSEGSWMGEEARDEVWEPPSDPPVGGEGAGWEKRLGTRCGNRQATLRSMARERLEWTMASWQGKGAPPVVEAGFLVLLLAITVAKEEGQVTTSATVGGGGGGGGVFSGGGGGAAFPKRHHGGRPW